MRTRHVANMVKKTALVNRQIQREHTLSLELVYNQGGLVYGLGRERVLVFLVQHSVWKTEMQTSQLNQNTSLPTTSLRES